MSPLRFVHMLALVALPAALFIPARRAECQGGPQSVKAVMNGCQLCHAEYVAEWDDSYHGLAWTDGLYQAAKEKLPKDQQAKCVACHLPNALQQTGPGKAPTTRTKEQAQGVACVSCHQVPTAGKPEDIGTIVGPFPVDQMAKSHAYKYDKTMGESVTLCASCHGTDVDHNQVDSWKESTYAKDGKSCQSCHMPAVRRTIQDKKGSTPRDAHKHTWPGAHDTAFLKKAATVEAKVEGGKVKVTITNSGAGHNFPGGGEREVVLVVTVTGADGKEAAAYRETFDLRTKNNRIKPKEARALEYDAKCAKGTVKAKLIYKLSPEQEEGKAVVVDEEETKF